MKKKGKSGGGEGVHIACKIAYVLNVRPLFQNLDPSLLTVMIIMMNKCSGDITHSGARWVHALIVLVSV